MATTSTQRVARTTVVASLLGLFTLLAPVLAVHRLPSARAATDLAIGQLAVVRTGDGDPVRLRRRPGFGAQILTLVPEGETVRIAGRLVEARDGTRWWKVTYGGYRGFMIADYLASATSDASGDTVTSSALNLRAGPSTRDRVLLVMPAGAGVSILGAPVDGFYPVRYQGIDGWAFGDYLNLSGGAIQPSETGTARVIDGALNLRAGPSTADAVVLVMPDGAVVDLLGEEANGFLRIAYNGVTGWAYGAYLTTGSPSAPSSAIIWPVSGGEWKISQGYNGFSHYNADSTYQYHYSFDIIRTDGNTAGQPVYSPVTGTIRWTERASGGIAINMENGYAVAMFHMTVDPSLRWGDRVSQGQYLGFISGPGQDGNMGFDHLHFTLWATDDGGNWSRVAVPFSGQNAIAGVDYPDTGGYNQWQGTVFYP